MVINMVTSDIRTFESKDRNSDRNTTQHHQAPTTMDFAAQLANLERSANAARRRPHNNDNNDRPRQRQRQDTTTQPKTPFQSLSRAGYRIDPFITKEDPPNQVRHVCLLAITIDELPYEDIWKQWATSTNTNGIVVSLVCHAKYPHNVQSEFLKKHLLQEPPKIGRGNQLADPVFRSHRPEWGSVEILRAMLDILHDGLLIGNNHSTSVDPRYDPTRYLMTPLEQAEVSIDESSKQTDTKEEAIPQSKIPPADMFVFISETCLPIQPLNHWVETLDANRSWVNARNRETHGTPRNKYELDQFAMIRMVPADCRWKADQWMALCRPHAIAVRQIDNHMPERERLWSKGFYQVNASDEMYFPTVLAVLQLLKQQAEEDDAALVRKRPVTYTDWSQGMKNPATHTMEDLQQVTLKARAQGSLLARKFTGAIDLAEWERCCSVATSEGGSVLKQSKDA